MHNATTGKHGPFGPRVITILLDVAQDHDVYKGACKDQ